MDKSTEAIDRFQKSLKIDQKLSGDDQNDLNISVTIHKEKNYQVMIKMT